MADDERHAEIEAVAKALGRYDAPEHWDWREYEEPARMVVEALDRVRDARHDNEARPDPWQASGDPSGETHLGAHEEDIPEAALDAAEQAVHACRHYALGHPSGRALWVNARDEAYDVLAAALPHLSRAARSPQGEDHEAEIARGDALMAREFEAVDHEAGLRKLIVDWTENGDPILLDPSVGPPHPVVGTHDLPSPSRDGTVAAEDSISPALRAAAQALCEHENAGCLPNVIDAARDVVAAYLAEFDSKDTPR